MLTYPISSRSVYSVALWQRKTPIFAGFFWTSACSGVTSWQQSEKVEHGCTTANSPIQRYQNRFCTRTPSWRNPVLNLWRSKAWQTNRQTNRQKTQRFCPPWRRLKSEPHQIWHGDRGHRARSCTCKTFEGLRTVSPLGGAENLETTRLHQLKTPITP